jgi:hypothetical protein
MSNLWISAKSVSGPQAVTAPAEPNSEQATWALPSVNYQNTLVASTAPTEPNSAQATWGITSLNYA